jgi:hypothetical protein
MTHSRFYLFIENFIRSPIGQKHELYDKKCNKLIKYVIKTFKLSNEAATTHAQITADVAGRGKIGYRGY